MKKEQQIYNTYNSRLLCLKRIPQLILQFGCVRKLVLFSSLQWFSCLYDMVWFDSEYNMV